MDTSSGDKFFNLLEGATITCRRVTGKHVLRVSPMSPWRQEKGKKVKYLLQYFECIHPCKC